MNLSSITVATVLTRSFIKQFLEMNKRPKLLVIAGVAHFLERKEKFEFEVNILSKLFR